METLTPEQELIALCQMVGLRVDLQSRLVHGCSVLVSSGDLRVMTDDCGFSMANEPARNFFYKTPENALSALRRFRR